MEKQRKKQKKNKSNVRTQTGSGQVEPSHLTSPLTPCMSGRTPKFWPNPGPALVQCSRAQQRQASKTILSYSFDFLGHAIRSHVMATPEPNIDHHASAKHILNCQYLMAIFSTWPYLPLLFRLDTDLIQLSRLVSKQS